MQDREVDVAPPALPARLAGRLGGYRWARNLVGESGAQLFRLSGRAGAPDLYVKTGEDELARALRAEAERLAWFAPRLPVPDVVALAEDGGAAWLVMTALPGATAREAMVARPEARGALVDALAGFARRLHALPVADCPFDSGHGVRMAEARARIDAGLVDTDDFDPERQGWSAEQVWAALVSHLPLAVEPVVTHGDFSLDNLLVQDGRVTGMIDVGRAGVADRWQDLAILWNSLGEFGPGLQARFLGRYRLAAPDPVRLAFHLLLDELF